MENNNIVVPAPIEPEKKWTSEQINTIRNTVAPKANDNELKMFLSIAANYDLDPFLREIWCVDMGGRNVITTSRDGYLKIANRNPNYDGMSSDVVRAGDNFVKIGDDVKHSYGTNNRGPIIGAYAIVHRKDRSHPVYCFAPFSEYNKGKNSWAQYPSAMILKVAETMALKRAFSISGLVTEEEIGTGEEQKSEQRETQAGNHQEAERKIQLNQLYQRYMAVLDNNKNHVFNAMKKITGKDSSKDFTSEDIKALFDDVREREYKQMDNEVEAQQNSNNTDFPVDAPIVDNNLGDITPDLA